jgi:hypothetical protein
MCFLYKRREFITLFGSGAFFGQTDGAPGPAAGDTVARIVNPDLTAKRLELLDELVPATTRSPYSSPRPMARRQKSP